MPVILPLLADRHDDRSSGTRRWTVDLRSALAISGTVAALLEIAHRAERSRPRRSARRGCEKMPSASDGCLARPLDLIAEQGHRPVGEPVEQRARLRDPRSRRRRRASAACSLRQSRTAARTSASTARKLVDQLAGGRGRRRGRARCTSSIRAGSLSSHSGSTAVSLPSSSRSTQTTGWSRRWMVSWRAGDRVGDRIDQERHVVVDDARSASAAGRPRRRSIRSRSPLRRACALRADSARKRAASCSARGVEALEFAGQRILRQRLANAIEPSGFARRVWAVMKSIGSADVAMPGAYRPAPREADNPAVAGSCVRASEPARGSRVEHRLVVDQRDRFDARRRRCGG